MGIFNFVNLRLFTAIFVRNFQVQVLPKHSFKWEFVIILAQITRRANRMSHELYAIYTHTHTNLQKLLHYTSQDTQLSFSLLNLLSRLY